MEPFPTGVVGTAVVLGFAHAIEPDHIAGITGATSYEADRIAALKVAVAFAMGHVLLVAGWVIAWYITSTRLTDTIGITQWSSYVVAALLAGMAALAIIRGSTRLIHRHEHDHGAGMHTHFHAHLPGGHEGTRPFRGPGFLPGRLIQTLERITDSQRNRSVHSSTPYAAPAHEHDHGLRTWLRTGLLGALFTLSPPVSMLVFLVLVLPTTSSGAITAIVVVYAGSLVVGMGVIGLVAGWVIELGSTVDPRLHAGTQVVIGLAILCVVVVVVL